MGYLPHQGLPSHRAAVAEWLEGQGVAAVDERVFITHGAQHAISMSLIMLAGRGDIVLTEAVTYSGTQALAAHAGIRLHGVEIDQEGVIPAALDRAFTVTGSRVFYTMPTLQTPTGTTASIGRRQEIAAVVARHNAYIIEDDAYAFLFEQVPPPIFTLLPDRTFYAVSFAKCLAPGLRIGALLVPDSFRDRTINALRATGWMAPPIMAEVVARLMQNGGLARQVVLKREKAVQRHEIAERILGNRLRFAQATPGFHVWVSLPEGRSVTAIVAEAAVAGVSIAGPAALLSLEPGMAGIRLCIGAPKSEAELERALGVIAEILNNMDGMSVV
jgi:DNA-binding transcriptional MocR family regulator